MSYLISVNKFVLVFDLGKILNVIQIIYIVPKYEIYKENSIILGKFQ